MRAGVGQAGLDHAAKGTLMADDDRHGDKPLAFHWCALDEGWIDALGLPPVSQQGLCAGASLDRIGNGDHRADLAGTVDQLFEAQALVLGGRNATAPPTTPSYRPAGSRGA